jgi:hypothetical protein
MTRRLGSPVFDDEPISVVDQLQGLAETHVARVMGGNLTRILKVAA